MMNDPQSTTPQQNEAGYRLRIDSDSGLSLHLDHEHIELQIGLADQANKT